MTGTSITATMIGTVTRIAKGEYRVSDPDGNFHGFCFVTAPNRQAAMTEYLALKIFHGRGNDQDAKKRRDAALAIVGSALRNDGVAEIDTIVMPAGRYVRAALKLGFVARSHTIGGTTYLMVAVDDAGLDAIKSRLDEKAPRK